MEIEITEQGLVWLHSGKVGGYILSPEKAIKIGNKLIMAGESVLQKDDDDEIIIIHDDDDHIFS